MSWDDRERVGRRPSGGSGPLIEAERDGVAWRAPATGVRLPATVSAESGRFGGIMEAWRFGKAIEADTRNRQLATANVEVRIGLEDARQRLKLTELKALLLPEQMELLRQQLETHRLDAKRILKAMRDAIKDEKRQRKADRELDKLDAELARLEREEAILEKQLRIAELKAARDGQTADVFTHPKARRL